MSDVLSLIGRLVAAVVELTVGSFGSNISPLLLATLAFSLAATIAITLLLSLRRYRSFGSVQTCGVNAQLDLNLRVRVSQSHPDAAGHTRSRAPNIEAFAL